MSIGETFSQAEAKNKTNVTAQKNLSESESQMRSYAGQNSSSSRPAASAAAPSSLWALWWVTLHVWVITHTHRRAHAQQQHRHKRTHNWTDGRLKLLWTLWKNEINANLESRQQDFTFLLPTGGDGLLIKFSYLSSCPSPVSHVASLVCCVLNFSLTNFVCWSNWCFSKYNSPTCSAGIIT